MVIILHTIQKNRRLPPPLPQSWIRTAAGLRHGVPVKVAQHLLHLNHQGGEKL